MPVSEHLFSSKISQDQTMPISDSEVQKLLWNDFRSENSEKATKLRDIFSNHDLSSIEEVFGQDCEWNGLELKEMLDLGLQCAVIINPDGDTVTDYLLRRGANPIHVSNAVIKLKRATWPLFHPYSDTKYADEHDPDDESEDEQDDRHNGDELDIYESHDAWEGGVPQLLERTTALHIAALIGKAATTQKLLEATMKLLKKSTENQKDAMTDFKTCISVTGNSPLVTAAWMGKIDIVKLFLPYQAHIPGSGWLRTPLHAASARGHLDIVKLLIEGKSGSKKINNAAGWYGTPLCAASCHGQIEVAKFMIKNCASINPRAESELETPL